MTAQPEPSTNGPPHSRPDGAGPLAPPFDPLRLCVYATVALLTWILGPVAVLAFAALGLRGYLRARRMGLTRSECYLRDTRVVLAYLAVIAALAATAVGMQIASWVAG